MLWWLLVVSLLSWVVVVFLFDTTLGCVSQQLLIYFPCPCQLVCIDIVLEAGVLFPIWPYFFLCFVRRETSRRLRCPPVSVYFDCVIGFWIVFEFDGRVCGVPCVSWGVFHSGPVLVPKCRRGRVFVLSWSVYRLWYIVDCRTATWICLTY